MNKMIKLPSDVTFNLEKIHGVYEVSELMAVSSLGNLLGIVNVGVSQSIRIVDIATKKNKKIIRGCFDGPITALCFSLDDRKIFVASGSKVLVFDVFNEKIIDSDAVTQKVVLSEALFSSLHVQDGDIDVNNKNDADTTTNKDDEGGLELGQEQEEIMELSVYPGPGNCNTLLVAYDSATEVIQLDGIQDERGEKYNDNKEKKKIFTGYHRNINSSAVFLSTYKIPGIQSLENWLDLRDNDKLEYNPEISLERIQNTKCIATGSFDCHQIIWNIETCKPTGKGMCSIDYTTRIAAEKEGDIGGKDIDSKSKNNGERQEDTENTIISSSNQICNPPFIYKLITISPWRIYMVCYVI
jgi:hypothetical protein